MNKLKSLLNTSLLSNRHKQYLSKEQEKENKKDTILKVKDDDVYVKGIGGYDGTNAGAPGVKTLQEVIESIPAPQVNSDWNATEGPAEILNKPTVKTMKFTQTDLDGGFKELTDEEYDELAITDFIEMLESNLNPGKCSRISVTPMNYKIIGDTIVNIVETEELDDNLIDMFCWGRELYSPSADEILGAEYFVLASGDTKYLFYIYYEQ